MHFPLHFLKSSFHLWPTLSLFLLLAGCSALDPQANFKALIRQATRASTPVKSAPTVETNGSKSTLVMELSTRELPLTAQDKEAFASNLAIGDVAEQPSFVDDPKTDIWFEIPSARIVWWVSHDDRPGVLQVTHYDGPVGSATTNAITKEYYELTDEANAFARNWLAAQPQ